MIWNLFSFFTFPNSLAVFGGRQVVNKIEQGSASKSASSSFVRPALDSIAVSIFVDVLVEFTNTVFVNSSNISTHIETAVLSRPATSICHASHYHHLASSSEIISQHQLEKVNVPVTMLWSPRFFHFDWNVATLCKTVHGNICQTLSLSMSLFLAVLKLLFARPRWIFLRMVNTQLLDSRGGYEGWWQSFFRPKVWPGWAVWHCGGKVWSIHS